MKKLEKLKKYTERPGQRVLAFVLACVCLMLGVFFVQAARYAWNRNWYIGGSRDFTDTSACRSYVRDCNRYVRNYLGWQGQIVEEVASGYGGAAYSCVIRDADTGEILLDTTTEESRPAAEEQTGSYTEVQEYYFASGEQALSPDAAEEVVLGKKSRNFVVEGYVNLPVEPYEGCYTEWRVHELMVSLANGAIPLAIVFLLLAAAAAGLLLLWAAAWKEPEKNGLLSRIPADGGLALLLVFSFILFGWAQGLFSQVLLRMTRGAYMVYESLLYDFFRPSVKALLWSASGLPAALVIVEQRRLRCLRKGLLLNRLPLLGGIGLCLAGMTVLAVYNFIQWRRRWGIVGETIVILGLQLLLGLLCLALLAYFLRQMKKLRGGIEALAAGDLEHKLDAAALPAGLREQGESLNRIGEGMKRAVEEQLRGERFKTELITNVSHDLKTPLTSIVSYVDLLKKEDIAPPRAKEYLEVIDRQSTKLKKLTEDLVEASKASAGAIEVKKEPVDIGELLGQSLGEFSAKLAAADIEPVPVLPEEPCLLETDGRLLWRILDNLIQNIVKYAQPGTRAYFDLHTEGQELCLELKNTSAQPLNIPAAMLLERFVRGDGSRHTEGSGLGLSIAQSLTELLGGRMELYLDGDLFKVSLRFGRKEEKA